MAQKTSINIKPCNIGSSEAHNKRTAEYLANIRKEKFYIRTDLMAGNEAWVSPDFGEATLTDRYNQIATMVKEKTGRAMQTKDRERVNKKTGKVTIVRGSTPLKEGVVVIKDDTTMEQLRHFCEVCKQSWGITALQVFIHRDEGHYGIPGDNATWKPNFHAHIVWDWMNHDTGKSCKLDEKAMSEMQTVLAECLDMERGTSKEVTGKKHLERTDFIIAKQKQEAEQAKAARQAAIAAKEEAEAELLFVEGENKA
ncbi:MAG: mobilization protein, partial [Sodaliphilus sp.]|nr:mobilization protein [Sodaliphilus sp.]